MSRAARGRRGGDRSRERGRPQGKSRGWRGGVGAASCGAADEAVQVSRSLALGEVTNPGGGVSAGAYVDDRGGRARAGVAGGGAGVQVATAAGVSALGWAGWGGAEDRRSIWSRRSRMSLMLGSFRFARARSRNRRAEDLVMDWPDDVEASESWSDEDPSEAGEAESVVRGAKLAGGRRAPAERWGCWGGAAGTANVVLRAGRGCVAAVGV